MSRKIRQTKDNNIVIVCEGSETEVPYFEDLKREIEAYYPERFSKIRIVPVNEEKVRQSKKRASRSLQTLDYSYWVQIEENQELYEEFKAQPLRYVRETQLFMEKEGYVEGWAVFDHDNFPKRKEAFDLAEKVKNLHIAFSSISFEEWLLAHFERNTKSFLCSQCKDKSGRSIECEKDIENGCGGENCLVGYLRQKGYLENYDKSGFGLFASLKEHLKVAMINAAWLRHLDNAPIYERNPYTDVDVLVARLLAQDTKYEWVRLGDVFKYNGAEIWVEKENDKVRINSKTTCVILKENLINTDLSENESLLLEKNLILTDGMSDWFPITAPFLRLDSGANSFFMDLN